MQHQLRLVETAPGSYSLLRDALTAADGVLREVGREPNGCFWLTPPLARVLPRLLTWPQDLDRSHSPPIPQSIELRGADDAKLWIN
jgi:hypothetical protein